MELTCTGNAERPRERLLALGAAALTDCELLAIMLRSGVAGLPVLDLARELLARFGGVGGLLGAGVRDIRRQRGLGPARAAELKAMVELVRRALREEVAGRDVLTSPDAVRDYLRLALASLPYEVFMALFLDSQNRLLAACELFRGTLAQTSVYPREVVKAALAHNAAGVILAHNHPSGVAEPSRADELLTASLKQALALVDIRTLDHLIVAGPRVVSFAERGLI
jgi:DNA repair protein RadC